MVDEAPEPQTGVTEYARMGIGFRAGDEDVEPEIDEAFIETGVLPFVPREPAPVIGELIGQAILRLRIYRGLSQKKLEIFSGVDQTTISRLEHANARGLSIGRLFAILKALRAEEITFGPGPGKVPQSSWEDAMYGDMWERAGRLAERRLSRRRSA